MYVDMWVIVKTDKEEYSKYFRYKFIRYYLYVLINIIKGNNIKIYDIRTRRIEIDNLFKTTYGLLYGLIIILMSLFIFTCLCLAKYNDCQRIDFNSNSCEKWRNY